nr:HAD-IA family hydrolase [uncultured Actinoplanes sp.]
MSEINPSDIEAILFDMDGTLVDSDGAVERAWLTWSEEYGVDGAAAIRLAHGSPSESTVRKLLPHLDGDAVRAASARQLELQYDDLADVVATPGAHELLALLAELSLPWAVVTSADARLAKARLDAAGIEPAVLVTTDDIATGKPDPAGYRLAAELLHVPTGACLVVEDAEVGLEAARAAGAYTAALRGLTGDLTLTGLPALTEFLRRR